MWLKNVTVQIRFNWTKRKNWKHFNKDNLLKPKYWVIWVYNMVVAFQLLCSRDNRMSLNFGILKHLMKRTKQACLVQWCDQLSSKVRKKHHHEFTGLRHTTAETELQLHPYHINTDLLEVKMRHLSTCLTHKVWIDMLAVWGLGSKSVRWGSLCVAHVQNFSELSCCLPGRLRSPGALPRLCHRASHAWQTWCIAVGTGKQISWVSALKRPNHSTPLVYFFKMWIQS